jgi:hypothetical protein
MHLDASRPKITRPEVRLRPRALRPGVGGEAPTTRLLPWPSPMCERVPAPRRTISATSLAPQPTGAQLRGVVPAQPTWAAVVEGLVDRLVADMPVQPVGLGVVQPGGNLLRAPLQLEAALDDGTPLDVVDQATTPPPSPSGGSGSGVGEVSDRRDRGHVPTLRRSSRLMVDGPDPPVGRSPARRGPFAQRGDPLALDERQVAIAQLRAAAAVAARRARRASGSRSCGRSPRVGGPPPCPRLEHQRPVLVLHDQLRFRPRRPRWDAARATALSGTRSRCRGSRSTRQCAEERVDSRGLSCWRANRGRSRESCRRRVRWGGQMSSPGAGLGPLFRGTAWRRVRGHRVGCDLAGLVRGHVR